mgnify:FL=1
MKPLNSKEIYLSFFVFLLYFSLLLCFTLGGVYFYFLASFKEYSLLKKKSDDIESLMANRLGIIADFTLINQRFTDLGEQNSGHANQIAQRRILQMEIANSSSAIQKRMLRLGAQEDRPSLRLYERLNTDVKAIAKLQDSLFTTKNQIESKRLQLSNCLESNKKAVDNFRKVNFRR